MKRILTTLLSLLISALSIVGCVEDNAFVLPDDDTTQSPDGDDGDDDDN